MWIDHVFKAWCGYRIPRIKRFENRRRIVEPSPMYLDGIDISCIHNFDNKIENHSDIKLFHEIRNYLRGHPGLIIFTINLLNTLPEEQKTLPNLIEIIKTQYIEPVINDPNVVMFFEQLSPLERFENDDVWELARRNNLPIENILNSILRTGLIEHTGKGFYVISQPFRRILSLWLSMNHPDQYIETLNISFNKSMKIGRALLSEIMACKRRREDLYKMPETALGYILYGLSTQIRNLTFQECTQEQIANFLLHEVDNLLYSLIQTQTLESFKQEFLKRFRPILSESQGNQIQQLPNQYLL